jgi:hypothetical protein
MRCRKQATHRSSIVSVGSLLEVIEGFQVFLDDADDETISLLESQESSLDAGKQLTESSPQLPQHTRWGDIHLPTSFEGRHDHAPRKVYRRLSSGDPIIDKIVVSPRPSRWSANEKRLDEAPRPASRPAPFDRKRQPTRHSCSSAMSDISVSPKSRQEEHSCPAIS